MSRQDRESKVSRVKRKHQEWTTPILPQKQPPNRIGTWLKVPNLMIRVLEMIVEKSVLKFLLIRLLSKLSTHLNVIKKWFWNHLTMRGSWRTRTPKLHRVGYHMKFHLKIHKIYQGLKNLFRLNFNPEWRNKQRRN